MNASQKSILLFLFGCIPARLLLAYLSQSSNDIIQKSVGLIALGIAVGFFVIYFGGYRKTGAETFGKPIWWNNLRPIHGLLYLSVFIVIWLFPQYKNWAWKILLLDVVIGLGAFLIHHLFLNKP